MEKNTRDSKVHLTFYHINIDYFLPNYGREQNRQIRRLKNKVLCE